MFVTFLSSLSLQGCSGGPWQGLDPGSPLLFKLWENPKKRDANEEGMISPDMLFIAHIDF